jgi:WhiB family redox-sensing transcriptional regulator
MTTTQTTTAAGVLLPADILLPELLNTELGWQSLAECRQYNGDDWYPDKGDGGTAARAKRVCATCPVISLCRDHALRTREPHGIWGGLTAAERARILRARRKAAAHVVSTPEAA